MASGTFDRSPLSSCLCVENSLMASHDLQVYKNDPLQISNAIPETGYMSNSRKRIASKMRPEPSKYRAVEAPHAGIPHCDLAREGVVHLCPRFHRMHNIVPAREMGLESKAMFV